MAFSNRRTRRINRARALMEARQDGEAIDPKVIRETYEDLVAVVTPLAEIRLSFEQVFADILNETLAKGR